MNTRNRPGRLVPWLACAVLAVPATGLAAGFAITEENATGLGAAYSDIATGNGNASGMYYNPAAMSLLPGTQLSAGVIYIAPNIHLQNGRSTTLGLPSSLANVSGGDGGNAGVNAWVPNVFITHQMDARTHIGLGISVPYGLSTHYDSQWLGRYHAIRSEVQVINLNPAVSFDATPAVRLGLGLDIQHASANLTSAVDSRYFCLAGGGQAQTCSALPDGKARVKGNDWALGWNAGLIWRVDPATRIGLSYRSAVDHTLKGRVDYSSIPTALLNSQQLARQLADSNARASLNLPASAGLGVSHAFTPRWTMTASLLWTQWSGFRELRVVKSNGALPIVTTEHWKDTLRYALGASYRQSDRLTWRAGLAYDPTPVPNAQHRTARLPDSNRTWLSVGLGYHLSKQAAMDVGYTHIWFNKVNIDNTTEGVYKNTLSGTYAGSVDILGMQYSYSF